VHIGGFSALYALFVSYCNVIWGVQYMCKVWVGLGSAVHGVRGQYVDFPRFCDTRKRLVVGCT